MPMIVLDERLTKCSASLCQLKSLTPHLCHALNSNWIAEIMSKFNLPDKIINIQTVDDLRSPASIISMLHPGIYQIDHIDTLYIHRNFPNYPNVVSF